MSRIRIPLAVLIVAFLPLIARAQTLVQVSQTAGTIPDSYPAVSADGQTLAPWAGDIYMAFPDGSGLRRITKGGSFHADLVGEAQHELNGDGTVALFASQGDLTGKNPEKEFEVFVWKDALTRSGTAAPGGTVWLHLEDGGRPHAPYVVRCALSRENGIRIPGVGTVPLTPDHLFYLSGRAPSIFRAFDGTLDGSGRATASIAIPNRSRLRGFAFYASFLTVASHGVALHNPVRIEVM
jgi:hypothetical protein